LNNINIKPLKLYIFYCSNSLDINEFNRSFHDEEGIEYKSISLPCSGKADLLYLVKAFEKGADGLALITCDKNKCHYLEGNLRSPKRAEEVNSLLEEIGMGKERITVLSVNGDGISHVVSRINEFSDKIRNLEPQSA
jgi:coenzyme F420-reducing hydrogenase delta subunit